MFKIIVIEPDKMPYVKEISGSLESMQEIVGGYIEILPINNDYMFVLNEEGKLLDLPINFSWYNDLICGTVFICRNEVLEMGSLTDADVSLLLRSLSVLRIWQVISVYVTLLNTPSLLF